MCRPPCRHVLLHTACGPAAVGCMLMAAVARVVLIAASASACLAGWMQRLTCPLPMPASLTCGAHRPTASHAHLVQGRSLIALDIGSLIAGAK